jgi:hypothetical protein
VWAYSGGTDEDCLVKNAKAFSKIDGDISEALK